jgi:hypothetical protein
MRLTGWHCALLFNVVKLGYQQCTVLPGHFSAGRAVVAISSSLFQYIRHRIQSESADRNICALLDLDFSVLFPPSSIAYAPNS